MHSCNQVSILGNDKRMDYVAQYLFDKGYEINKEPSKIKESNIVIVEPNSPLETESIIECLKPGTKLFLPKTNLLLDKLCFKKSAKLYDYMSSSDIIRENARLTANGILKEAKKYGVVLEESNCLVSGFGYCGKAIAKELLLNKANVDVFVRRKDIKKSIESLGYKHLLMSDFDKISFEKYSYVFNTVPALIFTSKILDRLPASVIIFDIASMPGGVDFQYCDSKQIEYHHSLGIPGKMFPKEAGLLIAREIFNNIYNVSDPICK